MAYQVAITTEATEQLEAIFIETMIDSEMLAAMFQIYDELESHPLQIGDAKSSSVHRVVYRSPLAIEYYVIEDDKRVIVESARLYYSDE